MNDASRMYAGSDWSNVMFLKWMMHLGCMQVQVEGMSGSWNEWCIYDVCKFRLKEYHGLEMNDVSRMYAGSGWRNVRVLKWMMEECMRHALSGWSKFMIYEWHWMRMSGC